MKDDVLEITTDSITDNLFKNRSRIYEPFTEDGPGGSSKASISGKNIVIRASSGVRVVKLKAFCDGNPVDEVYIGLYPYDADKHDLDEELYATVRHKVEAKLWTEDMSNLEKLRVLAGYIMDTCHYPDTPAASKTGNPTFWENFSVDDKELLYDMFSMTLLNKAMDLQGGITTCLAVEVVERAAVDDLGLRYLYEDGEVKSGEGVWIGAGAKSSNPSAPGHVTLYYKDVDEVKHGIDAQGMMSSTCEEHDCASKIISLE